MRINSGSKFLTFCCEIITNACAHSVVLSDGLGGGRVLQVEHSGSGAAAGTLVIAVVGSVDAGLADMVEVRRVSVQHGGGPIVVVTGGRRSWKDVAMSVGSVTLFDTGAMSNPISTGEGSESGVSEVLVPTALSMRSKCLVMS
jgi:hypothetical protein